MKHETKAAIDKALDAGHSVKQTFVHREKDGRLLCFLCCSYNALSSAPMIDVGLFDDHAEGRRLTSEAFQYAFEEAKRRGIE